MLMKLMLIANLNDSLNGNFLHRMNVSKDMLVSNPFIIAIVMTIKEFVDGKKNWKYKIVE